MRRTLILTLAVLAAALSVCAGSLLALNDELHAHLTVTSDFAEAFKTFLRM